MGRISDTNAKRKLQFGQATMLGIKFEDVRLVHTRPPSRWHFILPAALQPPGVGYASGWYRRRWEAVEAALRVLEVVE